MSGGVSSTIVITGGAGFVGQHLAAELRNRPNTNIVSWDQPDIDITDPETFRRQLETEQPAWIVHLAGIAAVGTSLKDPDLVRRVNINGTKNVLQAVKQLSPGTQVLVASSADIYGAKANEYSGRPLPELPLVDALPQNPYAISKLDMERMIVDEFNDFVIRVRPFPHIGPGQKLGFVTADFASQIAAIETGRQESTMQVGNLKAERDFTDVRDVVRAYRLLLEQGQVGEVYHVATGQGTSIQSILDQLVALSGMQITVEQDAERMRPSDIPSLIGDASKLQAATGWKPAIGLADSLKDILEYWRRAQ